MVCLSNGGNTPEISVWNGKMIIKEKAVNLWLPWGVPQVFRHCYHSGSSKHDTMTDRKITIANLQTNPFLDVLSGSEKSHVFLIDSRSSELCPTGKMDPIESAIVSVPILPICSFQWISHCMRYEMSTNIPRIIHPYPLICIYIYMYVYMYIYIYVYVYVYMYMYIYVYIYMYMYIHVYI